MRTETEPAAQARACGCWRWESHEGEVHLVRRRGWRRGGWYGLPILLVLSTMFLATSVFLLAFGWPMFLRSPSVSEWRAWAILLPFTCAWVFCTCMVLRALVCGALSRVTFDTSNGTTTLTYLGLVKRTLHELPGRLFIDTRVDRAAAYMGFNTNKETVWLVTVWCHTVHGQVQRKLLKAVKPLRMFLEDNGITLEDDVK